MDARGSVSSTRLKEHINAHPRSSLFLAPIVFLLLVTIALGSGLSLDFPRDEMLQFVGAEELAALSWDQVWASLHMQPPGFNLLLRFTDALGSNSEYAWLFINVIATMAALWMVGDIVLQLTKSVALALASSVVAALMPGTLYYSLWVFYTALAASLVTLALWGLIVGLVRRSLFALLAASIAPLGLFILRSTYAWPLLFVWLTVLAVLIVRRTPKLSSALRRLSLLGAVVSAALIAAVQLLAFMNFSSVSQSSWAYENAAKALMTQLTDDQIQKATGDDPCLMEVVAAGVFEPIDVYPACARDSSSTSDPVGNSLLTSEYWVNGFPNMNHEDRLNLSKFWQSFALNAVMENPMSALRIPFPNFETQERGSLLRFLWPSSWYWLIDANVSAGGMWSSVWILAFSWVPVASFAGIIIGLIVIRRTWVKGEPTRVAYLASAVTVLALSVAYLYLETGENERFRVEIDFSLVALGAVGWWLLLRGAPDNRSRSVDVGTDTRERHQA